MNLRDNLRLFKAVNACGGAIPSGAKGEPITIQNAESVFTNKGRVIHVEHAPEGDVVTDVTDYANLVPPRSEA